MKQTKKDKWLECYKHTLNEYENDTHDNSPFTCKKCILAGFSKFSTCNYCPESVFNNDLYCTIGLGCTNRNAAAKYSLGLSPRKKQNLITYHKKAIKYLESIDKFNMDEFKMKLLIIDKQFKR
jgi:hypothetical protein